MGVGSFGFILVFFGVIVILSWKVFGRLIASYIAGKISTRLMNEIFYPGDKNFRDVSSDLSAIKTKLANGDIDTAIELLKGELEEDPRSFQALDLLSDIYLDYKGDLKATYQLLNPYFSSSQKRNEKDINLLMKLVDIYVEAGSPDKAISLLEKEIDLGYPANDINAIKIRLKAFDK